MPDDKQTMSDWLSAQQRLTSGRVSDPSQDAIGPASAPGWWWEQQAYRQRQTPGLIPPPQDVEALPLGSLSDPVSQAAFLLAPGAMRAGKEALDLLGQPGYSRSFGQGGPLNLLRSQRGNLGPVPRSEYGEALPRSVVRGADGKLTKLHHGTSRVYPDFDPAQSGTGAGGDLYGPGIYMTDSAEEAGGRYATFNWPDEARDAYRSLDVARGMRAYHEAEAGNARDLNTAMYHLGEVEKIHPMEQQAAARIQREMEHAPWHFTDGANIRPVYADLKRPFAIDATYAPQQFTPLLRSGAQDAGYGGIEDLLDAHGDSAMSGQDLYTALTRVMGDKAAVSDLLQRQGYDGITHMGGNTSGPVHRVFIAFSPEHVYPAPNVEALR